MFSMLLVFSFVSLYVYNKRTQYISRDTNNNKLIVWFVFVLLAISIFCASASCFLFLPFVCVGGCLLLVVIVMFVCLCSSAFVVCLWVRLLACLLVCLFVCPFDCLFVFFVFVCLLAWLFACLLACLSSLRGLFACLVVCVLACLFVFFACFVYLLDCLRACLIDCLLCLFFFN